MGDPKAPLSFPPTAVPIVGQPFSIQSLYCPVNAVFTCNCGGAADTTVTIAGSVAASCPACQTSYNVAFNPTTGKLEVRVHVPTGEKVPS